MMSVLKPKPDPKYQKSLKRIGRLPLGEQREVYKLMALNDLYFLCKYILLFWWLCDEPHEPFARKIQDDEPQSLYLLPRGHCKTLIFSIGHSIQCILKKPEDPIGLGSDTAKRAKRRIRVVKYHFESNNRLRWLFPDEIWENPKRQSPKWTDEELILPGHDGRQEPTIMAFGIDKQMPTGLHFPRIKLDDIVTPENSNTPDLIQNTIENFGYVRSSILQAFGNIQICGTIYDDADCHRTLEESGEYKVYKRSAESHPTDPSKNEALWPEQYPLTTLDAIKRDPTVGHYIYSCQYLLDPAPDDEHAYFQMSWFKRYETLPERLDIYAGIDFAIEEKKEADFTAIVVVGVDSDNQVYVLDVIRGHWDSLLIINNMFHVQLTWNPLIFVVEKDIIQRVLGPFLELKMKEEGIFINMNPRIPHTDKVARARSIQGRAREGAVLLPKKGATQPEWLTMFEFALRRFPRGKIKDVIDAFSWIGIELQDSAERWTRRQVFYMFGDEHLGDPEYKEQFDFICGLVPPEHHPFYSLWVQPVWRYGKLRLHVLRELQLVDEPLDKISRKLRGIARDYERRDMVYTADDSIRDRRGSAEASYFYQFGDQRIDIIPSRVKSDLRVNMLRESLLGHKERKIIIHGTNCPLLVRALKTAKWKFVNGIRTDTVESDPMLYPLPALECAIEMAVSEKQTTGY
jgi:predicted phage terminase large subunit-like protein